MGRDSERAPKHKRYGGDDASPNRMDDKQATKNRQGKGVDGMRWIEWKLEADNRSLQARVNVNGADCTGHVPSEASAARVG